MGFFPRIQVLKDFIDDLRLVDEANAHFSLAFGTDEGICFVDLLNEVRPASLSLPGQWGKEDLGDLGYFFLGCLLFAVFRLPPPGMYSITIVGFLEYASSRQTQRAWSAGIRFFSSNHSLAPARLDYPGLTRRPVGWDKPLIVLYLH